VSFTCRPGEIFGLLGRNGAGKTTTLRILATILTPTAGSARILGHDVLCDGEAVRRSVGFQTGDTRLYDRLTGREALQYFGRLQSMPDDVIEARIAALSDQFELTPFGHRRIGTLSNGQKQRVSLARALLHDPPALLLDEPTVGLDILAARETLELVRLLRDEGRIILFSTHILPEVERICDVVGILDDGKLLACDTVDAIRRLGDGNLENAFISLIQGRVEVTS
jgi:sodium transport system ATP-binding protein